ncbi:hypothetical protein [Clostridium beijerinckii]|uniref:BMFP domain-containing protein YqiC n=1 Tax=Clostridium beijerinckii TaxID=1520 RepID=A0AAX0AZT0_CLOBE|nr:hypothetical protein [Clostridium beijerinckii]NRT88560.1 BMFP domain-containing protein YqiC [Clostridium beijerinckii]NYC74015.1 BMFP domain-containing protein YqiC [Clostridium beijerinckii]
MQVSLKEIGALFEKLDEKIDLYNGIEEAYRKNGSCTIEEEMSMSEYTKNKIEEINEKVNLLMESAIVEMDEDTSEIYKALKGKSKRNGRKIPSKVEQDIEKKIVKVKDDIEKILEEFRERIK